MIKINTKYKDYPIVLTIHHIDGEVSEVYASWLGQEIAFDYDIDGCKEKVEEFFKGWI